ncbi:hypothetical protein cce_2976 [Crocosphaera subtropica ATCC 51142]|uniref:Uncharacterized protein n=1 Tax=Crocosphaera subtropica (strain ATCC 51142 / BH68) TaxID=43989 RepID=B1WVZ1_CROS5|nr:hypothetical protein [Crocosphaera subtropica]ACB52324.1 hypothetical protein cce_2976 [Crocosphaera subtropica ATCC 51142]
MTSWEFLIQKDDDLKWYPASSSNLELEPGKYRILAKSNRFNSVVDVRISSSNQEIQCHQRRINSQGLVMVLPFTELTPETSLNIRCHGDVLSEFLGENWTETITLNVSPAMDKSPSVKSSDSSENEVANNNKAQVYLEQLEKLLREKIEPRLNKKQQPEEQKTNNQPLQAKSLINLSLEQDDFIINSGERISLSGILEAVNMQGEIALNAQLRYELIHPETEEILLSVDYPLSDKKLPYHFNHTLVIPDDIDDDFIVGELILETLKGYPLNHASFTIRTQHYYPVNCTIELMDTETDDSYIFDLELAERINNKHTHLELPNTHRYSRLFPSHFRKSRQILPPKLEHHFATEERKNLKLPKIS